MAIWARCLDCRKAIQRSDYSAEDAERDYYECPECQCKNPIDLTLAETYADRYLDNQQTNLNKTLLTILALRADVEHKSRRIKNLERNIAFLLADIKRIKAMRK